MKDQTRRDNSAESAYKAMGSLFFSCVGIKFSDRYNARYGREDLFRHLVVMRGKHGYAEGTSNVEGVDASTPPLPSGRWTLGKIRSVPEDRMMARCDRMIRRSVKRLKRHGLFRKPVDLAIDFHDICRYDKNPNMKFMRHSKYKNGTHLFNTLATVHCVTEGSPGVPGGSTAHRRDAQGRDGHRPAGHVP